MTTSKIPTATTHAINDKRRAFLVNGMRVLPCIALAKIEFAHAAMCVEPGELSSAQRSVRKAAQYQDGFEDEKKTCRHCAMFKAREGDCGDCRELAGPVSAGGHCTSWTAREGT